MMNDREARDVLRDAIALISANVLNDDIAEKLALDVLRKRTGEDVTDWLERVATTLDILAATAGAFLERWADHSTLSHTDLLRVFAENLEAQSSRRDRGETGS